MDYSAASYELFYKSFAEGFVEPLSKIARASLYKTVIYTCQYLFTIFSHVIKSDKVFFGQTFKNIDTNNPVSRILQKQTQPCSAKPCRF